MNDKRDSLNIYSSETNESGDDAFPGKESCPGAMSKVIKKQKTGWTDMRCQNARRTDTRGNDDCPKNIISR